MKNIVNYSLFPICLQYRENFLTDKECDKIMQLVPSSGCMPHDAFTGNSVSSHKSNHSIINDIDTKGTLGLGKRIQSEINEFTKTNGFQACEYTNSWINYQYKGSVLESHTHPGSIISGALYLKVDQSSSKINFFNPNPFSQFIPFDKNNFTQYSFQHVWFQPKVGDLFLFPSWLKHGADGEKNNSEERVVLSFNCLQNFFR